MMKSKIMKICDSFSATLFELPNHPSEFNEKQQSLEEEQGQTQTTVSLTKKNIEAKLTAFQTKKFPDLECSQITFMQLFVAKESCVYDTLNFFQSNPTTYLGFFWIPTSKRETLIQSLSDLKKRQPNLQHAEI